MKKGIKKNQTLRSVLIIIFTVLGVVNSFALSDEYDEASDKYIVNAKTVYARFDQTTADGYNYIYWLRFNAPLTKGGMPTVSIENPSLPTVDYTIERAAGSLIRKELWCKDQNGNEVRIVLKYEEKPGARNAVDLKLYVDKYPGKRDNQQSIDATKAQNLYLFGSVLFSSENSILKPVKKWKAAIYPSIFQWMDANIPDIR